MNDKIKFPTAYNQSLIIGHLPGGAAEYPAGNIEYDHSIFPGGEIHVKLKSEVKGNDVLISACIRSSDDLMLLIMVTDALKREKIGHLYLYLPYVPYARQDRVCNKGESHSLRTFANLINAQGYDEVFVFDPHSDVTGAVFDKLNIFDNKDFVTKAIFDGDNTGEFVIISPDAGAQKKVYNLSKHIMQVSQSVNKLVDITYTGVIKADKLRDMETTAILGVEVHATEEDLAGKRCVIVDDICDGGRTFVELAKELRKLGADKITLIVSHGIFSQGLKPFVGIIDTVVSTNSLPAPEPVEGINYKQLIIEDIL